MIPGPAQKTARHPRGISRHSALKIEMEVNVSIYFVLVSVSCPKAVFNLESDILFHITVVVVADWLG